MTVRLSHNSFTGRVRTEVAVGTASDLSMFFAVAAATPRSVVNDGSSSAVLGSGGFDSFDTGFWVFWAGSAAADFGRGVAFGAGVESPDFFSAGFFSGSLSAGALFFSGVLAPPLEEARSGALAGPVEVRGPLEPLRCPLEPVCCPVDPLRGAAPLLELPPDESPPKYAAHSSDTLAGSFSKRSRISSTSHSLAPNPSGRPPEVVADVWLPGDCGTGCFASFDTSARLKVRTDKQASPTRAQMPTKTRHVRHGCARTSASRDRKRMRTTPRPRAAALVVTAVLVATATGCAGDEPGRTQPDDSPQTSSLVVHEGPTVKPLGPVKLGHVLGRLPRDKQQKVLTGASRVVDAWLTEAYLGGDYPRSDFARAYRGFTAGAKRQARSDRRLLTNLAAGFTEVRPRKRRIVIDVVSSRRQAVGATARVRVTFDAVRDKGATNATNAKNQNQSRQKTSEHRVIVRGRLFLTRVKGGWRIFGYDVSRGTL